MILTSYVKLPVNKNKKLCKPTPLFFEDLQILPVIVAEQRKLASEEASWSFLRLNKIQGRRLALLDLF